MSKKIMNTNELLSSLETSRKRIVEAINDFSDLEMIETATLGDWSIKDVLAHIAAWEAELVTALARDVAQNKRPTLADLNDELTQKLNAKWYAENKDRPLDRVRDDFSGVRKQLIRQINNFSEKDLVDPKKYKWLEGKTLADYIAGYANGHDEEHIEALKAWQKTHSH